MSIKNIPVVDFVDLLDAPNTYTGQSGYIVIVNPSETGLIFSPSIPIGSISLNQNHIFVGSALNIATDVAMSGEASIISSGTITLSNSAVISKILTGYVSAPGVVAASDSILQAIQKLNGNIGALVTGVSSVAASSPITSSGGANPIISTSISTNKLVGRSTAGTGVMEEIILGTNLSFSGTTLNAASPSGAALTKVDDTNITLTLGGTPTTALLQAVSLTLGWTGTLADARIASSATWNSKQAGSSNLTSLSGLTYASTAFVKMTGANTFSLDTNTYLTSVTAHNLLSITHGDTLADTVVRGDIIVGNSTPKWARLAKGAAGTILRYNTTDIVASTNTYPDTTGVGQILHATSANVIGSASDFVRLSTGELLLGASTLDNAEQLQVKKSQNAFTYASIVNGTSGTAAAAGLYVAASSVTSSYATLLSLSAAYTTSNMFVANTSVLLSTQSGGLNIGTAGALQVSLWTNNTKALDISSAGTLTLGTLSDKLRVTTSTGGSSGLSIGLGNNSTPTYGLDLQSNDPFVTSIRTTLYTNANNPVWITRNSRGTTASPTTLLDADTVGAFAFLGNKNTTPTFAYGGYFSCEVDGTPSTNIPTRFVFKTSTAAGSVLVEALRITAAQNIKIAGSAVRATTEGTNHLDIFDGTAPVGTLANGISLFSASGELKVADASGTITLLSPHDNDNYWVFDSEDTVTGNKLHIDVEKLLRFVNDHFGLDFIQGNMIREIK